MIKNFYVSAPYFMHDDDHHDQHVVKKNYLFIKCFFKTSQELLMLSSVTLNCQPKKIVMTSVFHLSEL